MRKKSVRLVRAASVASVLVLLLGILAACGSGDPTPRPAATATLFPTATPGLSAGDVTDIITQALQGQPEPAAGLTSDQVERIIAQAIEGVESLSAEDVAKIAQDAVAAASHGRLTEEELLAAVADAATQAAVVAAEAAVFQSEWDKLIAAAQKEGTLRAVQGDASSRDFAGVVEEFERKFGIEVLVETGRARVTLDKVLAERANGRYETDTWQAGGIPSGSFGRLANAGGLIPVADWLIEPYVKDPSNWINGEIVYGDQASRDILCYSSNVRLTTRVINTDLVEPDEIKTVWDLLDPKWGNGLQVEASDPRFGAEGISTYTPLFANPLGKDWYERYWREARPTLQVDTRAALDGIIRGTYAIGTVGAAGDIQLEEALALGLPIQEIEIVGFPTWRVGSGGCIGVSDRAPHPNAAKLFVNWLLSEEGWDVRVRTVTANPESAGGSTAHGISLIKGYSEDHLDAQDLLQEGEKWYSIQTDAVGVQTSADALVWVKSVIDPLGY